VQKADVYMFDEPSSFLDVKQRLAAGRLIRSLLGPDSYVIVVEHDLSILDYLSDYICVLYGKPAVYGVVTAPFSVREGINIFLDGNVPTENLRFRDESLQFRIGDASEDFLLDKTQGFTYPAMEKTLGNFHLKIDPGTFTGSEILVMMGENGTGKTTFCKMLAGALKPDNDQKVPPMNISMKPQKITPKFQGTVRQLFFKRIKAAFINPQFQTDVYKPLKMDDFIDQEVQNLSGGELQRVAIVLALGMPADIYVIDEPSAYLDSEQRIIASRVIKRFIMHAKKTAFIVEHDFIMATYLADRVIVFDGQPSIESHANTPESLLTGCNTFLKALDVTFRRDPSTYRPRINKLHSVKDAEQKAAGSYVSNPLNILHAEENRANKNHSTSWTKSLERRRQRLRPRRSSRLQAQRPVLAPGRDKAAPRDQKRSRRATRARGRRGGRGRQRRLGGQHTPPPPRFQHTSKVVAQALVDLSADRQAMGVGNQAHPRFPVLLLIVLARVFCCCP
jgi:ATP-binding cassette subfamily E protein 1